ncbi:MAG: hypothetical protein RR202_07390 [Bacteroidales bacterium]
MKTRSLFGILMLLLFAVSYTSCEKEKDSPEELTPEVLYQTSWRGKGHCDAWVVKDRSIGIQFIDTQKGKVNWQDYDEFDITYVIKGKYIEFNDIAFQLAGAPWVIKSYTKTHITLIQNEASPDKGKIATIELDRID